MNTPLTTHDDPAEQLPARSALHTGRTGQTGKLRNRRDFTAVLRGGRRARRPHLSIAVRANGLDTDRVGFAVGRRVGGAVVRNQVRRRLREVVRAMLARELPTRETPSRGSATSDSATRPRLDIVVTALEGASALPFAQLEAELLSAARQVELSHAGHMPSAGGAEVHDG